MKKKILEVYLETETDETLITPVMNLRGGEFSPLQLVFIAEDLEHYSKKIMRVADFKFKQQQHGA